MIIERVSFNNPTYIYIYIYLFIPLTYSRWAPILPTCLWALRIFPSLPGSLAPYHFLSLCKFRSLLQLVNQWTTFTYSRTFAFRYGRQNKNLACTRIDLSHDFRTSRCADYLPTTIDHSGDEGNYGIIYNTQYINTPYRGNKK